MKAGSLVECVDTNFGIQRTHNEPQGMIFPNKGVIYTVRHIFHLRDGRSGLTVNEIDNSRLKRFTPSKLEPAFNAKNFRELQPPIANIEEHINENTLEPVLK